MILFTVLMFQESTAHKHGRRSAAAVTWTLPNDREETLDGIVEVGAVFLTVAVLIAPLTIQTVYRRGTLLEGFTFLKPCIHKLADAVRLRDTFVSSIGEDICITGYPAYPEDE